MTNITSAPAPDLNLLRTFVVIAEERNLSRAGARLGLSQPALSHGLKRLRAQFADPLFVRIPHGLAPTPRALELLPEVRQALGRLDSLYASVRPLAPGGAGLRNLERRLAIGMTTYFEMRVIGSLLRDLSAHAPRVTLHTHSLTEGFPKAELEDGRLDLACAAYFEKLPEGFRVRSLGVDPHVCVMRAGHPFRKKLTLAAYLSADHVKIAVPPGRLSAVDRVLGESGRSRKIVAELANFITPALVLEDSDLLLTCPRTLADRYVERLGGVVCELPIRVPGVELRMVWHERVHADPFQRWIRDRIVASTAQSGERGKFSAVRKALKIKGSADDTRG